MRRTRKLASPKNVFFGSVIIATVAIVLAALTGIRPIPKPEVWKGTSKFRAENAYEWTRKLAKDFPYRVPWRPERAAAAKFLKGELKKLGYEVSTIEFDEIIGSQHVKGLENIYAILPGKTFKDEYVVVLAHYDITDTTVEGATDDASGVGSVLELARIFKEGPAPQRNLIFLLTDSEEFGAFWGAHNFVKQFPHARQIVAAVSLDFVAPNEQQDILVLSDGLKNGYTPLWLRELALQSIRAVPYPAADTKNFLEFVQRALLIPPADHGAFLMAGIPALNLFGRSTDFTHQMAKIHHTPADNMENLRLESFVPYGAAAEILLRSIDAMPALATSPSLRESSYWKVSDRYFITGRASKLIHYLLFAPFIVYVTLLFGSFKWRRRSHVLKVIRQEARAYGLMFVSFLAGYVLLRHLPDLKIIAKYEMFPATQKSEILYRPEYLAIALIFVLVIALYVTLSRFFGDKAKRMASNALDARIRHSVHGVILGAVIFLAFLKNSYLGVLMLLPPAYLWMFMKSGPRRANSRLLNGLLFFGGLLSFIAICLIMAMVFHLGVFYWYLFLAISYGLISVYTMILAFAVITVGIRLLRNLIL